MEENNKTIPYHQKFVELRPIPGENGFAYSEEELRKIL